MTARVLTPERLAQIATSHAKAEAALADRADVIAAAAARHPERHGGLEVMAVSGGYVVLEAHPQQLEGGSRCIERPWPWGGAR